MTNPKIIEVAIGVIKQQQQVLIAQRPANTHLAGYWEFPGGKIEAGETLFVALARELKEEIGIIIHAAQPLLSIEHSYPEKKVRLQVCLVEQFTGIARGCEQQPIQWVNINELQQWQLPPANGVILEALACYA